MADIPSGWVPKLPDLSALATPSLRDLPPLRSPIVDNVRANYASEFYRRLVKMISDFDATLDEKHEVGVRLVSFGQSVVFHLADLGYCNPSLISFAGTTEKGDPVELIQHVSQISILLMKLPRQDPSKPKRRIGFCSDEDGAAQPIDGACSPGVD